MVGETIETENLLLRAMTIDDAEDAFSIWGNKDSAKFLADPYYKSADELRKLFADIEKWSDYPYIALEKTNGDFVGTCSIGPEDKDDVWGFGYCVAVNKRCKGYGTEIAQAMIDFARKKGIKVCIAEAAKDNTSSCRVLEKCGMHVDRESSFKKSGTNNVYKSNIYMIKNGVDKMENELNRINKCEKEYTECTSICYDRGKYNEYSDDKIKDMYDHNFYEIKDMTGEELQSFATDESRKRKENNIGFFKIKTGDLPKSVPVDFNGNKPEIEHLGAYVFRGKDTSKWKSIDKCVIKKVTDESMINDLIDIDIEMYADDVTKSFCIRSQKRMGEEYLSDSNLNMYICYLDGKAVGSCELYINHGTAKIESFNVRPEFQRKGIGTTFLKFLMEEANEKGADIRYLIADEDDTPKEMYLKLGYEKVQDIYFLFWQL